MPSIIGAREFNVLARHLDRRHGRMVTEPSFEAAAVAYVEDLQTLGDEAQIQVIVREMATGHEHCFLVDLLADEDTPCG